MCSVKLTTNVRSAVFRSGQTPTIVLSHAYCPVDNTLLEVSAEIALRVFQVATVAMELETTQLVLSQFNNFYLFIES